MPSVSKPQQFHLTIDRSLPVILSAAKNLSLDVEKNPRCFASLSMTKRGETV
jgi:hypothetical protein